MVVTFTIKVTTVLEAQNLTKQQNERNGTMDPNETMRIIQDALDKARETNDRNEFLANMIIVADFANMAFEWVDGGGFLPKTYKEVNSDKEV